MQHLPPLNYIRSFEAAARHQSFTRAAQELGLTQAAVSAHVRALETWVGRPLFRRGPRSLTPTEVAEAWLPALRQALAQIEAATGQILAVPHRQEVTLACPASLAANWLPRRLAAFRARHPDIGITVHATIWAESGDQIADLRIVPRHAGQPPLGLPLGEDRLVVVCAPGFLHGPDALRSPADVARKGLIHVLGREEHWQAFARHHGLAGLPLAEGPRTDSSNVALEMAAAGMGCAIAQESLAALPIERGTLVAPFADRIASGWGYEVQTGDLAPSRASERLLQFLLAAR